MPTCLCNINTKFVFSPEEQCTTFYKLAPGSPKLAVLCFPGSQYANQPICVCGAGTTNVPYIIFAIVAIVLYRSMSAFETREDIEKSMWDLFPSRLR